jgi:hypothetical protein
LSEKYVDNITTIGEILSDWPTGKGMEIVKEEELPQIPPSDADVFLTELVEFAFDCDSWEMGEIREIAEYFNRKIKITTEICL